MLFDDIAEFIVNFDTLSLEDKFLLLLYSQQTDIKSLVINYVNKCFETQAMQPWAVIESYSFYQAQFYYLIQNIIYLLYTLFTQTSW